MHTPWIGSRKIAVIPAVVNGPNFSPPPANWIIAALLVPLLVVIGSGSGTRAAPPGPTVPYQDSYPITVVAGDYDLVYWVLDFAPGAGIPLHSHGGPTAMLEVAGELTL